MQARILRLLLASAALLTPVQGGAAASPFGSVPPAVQAGPPRTPTDPDRWLPWRLFTWRDGVKPGNPALTQDTQGYIWADGPVRYNGRSWEKVDVPGEAGPVPCWSLLSASDGSLWFGRLEGGLLRLRNDVWTRFAPGSGLPSGLIGALAEGTPGTVWAGTSTGLARCRGDRCEEEKALRGTNVRSLAATRAEGGRPALWIGTERGLLRLDGIDGPAPVLSPRFADPAALPDLSIRGLVETVSPEGERALWVATDNGMACLRRGVWTRYDARSGFPAGPVVKLAASRSADGRPVVWAGSFRAGLLRFEEDGRWRLYDTRSGLPANVVYNLLLTPNGRGREPTLWAATPAGLARLEREHWTTIDTRSGLPNEIVIGGGEVTFPDGLHTYWIGTVGGMVRLTPRGWERYVSPVIDESDLVFNALVTPDEDGTPVFWMGTANGLHRFARGAWTRFTTRSSPLPHDWVVSLLAVPGPRGTALWASTSRGVARYERGIWTVYRAGSSGLPGNQVRGLTSMALPDGGRILWAGTEHGVARFQGEAWEKVDVPCLPNPVVFAVHPVAGPERGWLWIGTLGGAARLAIDRQGRPGKECQALTDKTRPAIPQAQVSHIQTDAWGRVYLLTDWGVSRVTAPPGRGLDAARVELFEPGDGLPGMSFNAAFVDHLGRIWGGATGGAAILDPAPPESAMAPLRLEKTLVGGRERPLAPGTALRHDESSVGFHYALLSYRREHATRYRTQLAGLEDRPGPWTAEAEVDYTRLPEGQYTFRVWGMDGDGTVSGPIEIPFRIRPAPWLTGWALTLYALALIGLGYGASHVRSLARRAAVLEGEVAERTRELAAANRQLELASLTDPLTGLSNRRFLAVSLAPDLRQAVRNALGTAAPRERNADLIFYFLDVDHFKQLNDRAGHAGGDQVLVEIAARLREAARTTDAVLRWGGEEFLIVSRWADRRSGEVLAERLLQVVGGRPFTLPSGISLAVTCSVGWAPFPWRPESPEAVHHEQVMSLADQALYLAKREGRNRAVGVLPGPDGSRLPEGPIAGEDGAAVRLVRSVGPGAAAAPEGAVPVASGLDV
jgi:diguanylate cyclase (GGDEF)-like protein